MRTNGQQLREQLNLRAPLLPHLTLPLCSVSHSAEQMQLRVWESFPFTAFTFARFARSEIQVKSSNSSNSRTYCSCSRSTPEPTPVIRRLALPHAAVN